MTRKPKLKAPPGACDCHIHIYGDKIEYPWAPVRHGDPPALGFEDYLAVRDRLGLTRTVVVQPSVYASDSRCTLDAIARLGPNARGVAVVETTITDEELQDLDRRGIRGLRFGIRLSNGMRPDVIEEMAPRIAPLGWHFQYRSTEKDLPDIAPRLIRLGIRVCVDHIGSIPPETGTDHPAFKALLRLVDTGRCWVKLSAPYQLSRAGGPEYADYKPQARALVAAAPERMVWGSNWPHPQVTDKPDDADLLDVLLDWADDEATIRKILVDNAAELYGFNR